MIEDEFEQWRARWTGADDQLVALYSLKAMVEGRISELKKQRARRTEPPVGLYVDRLSPQGERYWKHTSIRCGGAQTWYLINSNSWHTWSELTSTLLQDRPLFGLLEGKEWR